MKRGQITIFVIVGIVIIAVVAGGVYVNQARQERLNREFFESTEVAPTMESIQASALNCIESVAKEALDKIGVQGGYYNKPVNYLEIEEVFIPYYYYEGEIIIPSKQDVERELGNYMDDNLQKCLDEASFSGFELSYETPITSVSIDETEAYFRGDFGIEVGKEDYKMVIELEEYPVSIASELESMLEIAEYFGESHREDPALYCISCIGDMAAERDLYIDIVNIAEDSTLVVISENHTSSEAYSFEFLNKYTGEEVPTDVFAIEDEGFVQDVSL